MKTKVLFILSLALNAGLLMVLLAGKSGENNGAATTHPSPAEERATSETATPAAVQVVTETASQKFDWRVVESADYRKYIANLRAIGCPELTIRDIIIADVNKLFAARRNELLKTTNGFAYWKAGTGLGSFSIAQMDKLRALNRERLDVLRELLGAEVADDGSFMAAVNPANSMLDFLPADKQRGIEAVREKFQALFAKALNGGVVNEEAMRAAQKQMDEELQAMMTPEEYRQYQLRMSPTATGMRAQLAGFDPSETEFDQIFDIKKKFDDTYAEANLGATATQEDRDKLRTAEQQMNEQIKAALGEQRYAEYERAQDWNYQTLAQVASQYDLPKESAVKVYDMKRMAEAEASAIRKDKTLTADQRKAALDAIGSETRRSIQQVLGDQAWNSYENQAYWLNGLSAKTAPGKQDERPTGVLVLP